MPDTALTRRRVLAWLGGLGLAALIPGCADDGDSAAPTTTAAATTTTTTAETTVDCMLSPELTEGPYYIDLDLVRRDITEGRPGAPLELTVKVVDGDSCEPIRDAAVDVWHCDAEGVYSGVQGDDETFLRGIQMTDAGGEAVIDTIFPGWYTGRAVHIHLKVHVGGTETYTGQLFFDESVARDGLRHGAVQRPRRAGHAQRVGRHLRSGRRPDDAQRLAGRRRLRRGRHARRHART